MKEYLVVNYGYINGTRLLAEISPFCINTTWGKNLPMVVSNNDALIIGKDFCLKVDCKTNCVYALENGKFTRLDAEIATTMVNEIVEKVIANNGRLDDRETYDRYVAMDFSTFLTDLQDNVNQDQEVGKEI